LSAPDELRHGDLAAFEPSSKAVEFEALTDTEFVLGSVCASFKKAVCKHTPRRGASAVNDEAALTGGIGEPKS
jgi:hypothetical protein